MRFLRILCICGYILLTALLFCQTKGWAAVAGQQSELIFTSSLVSMASYSTGLNLMTREWLQEAGWHFDTKENINSVADGRFHLVSRNLPDNRSVYILAFPGTERLKDAEVDLRVKRVIFGGSTPAEFQSIAAVKEHNGAQPLVHQGFNDYTQVALFQQPLKGFGGMTAGEVIAGELKDHPDEVLYLTGHSLGGATATLAAARFADMGVRPEQLQVITFGAPAVGNESFARAYEHKMNLTRITMEADPVKSVLQSLTGAFVQFGSRLEWKNHRSERFSHDMVLYLDQALRNYQDTHDESERSPMLEGTPSSISGGVYVAPMQFRLDKQLRDDLPYMKRTLRSSLMQAYTPVTIAGEKDSADMKEMRMKAREAGCEYILVERFQGKRIRNEHYNYRLSMEEELYDVEGNLLTMQSTSTTAKELTPIEGMVYLQFQGKEQRDKFLH